MHQPASQPSRVAVAIPVRNEAERIGRCLRALASQRGAPPFDVVLMLNGCDDGTPELVTALAPTLPVRLHAIERRLPPGQVGAGHARRLALESAARLAPGGVLMTTDADGQVPPDWVARNLSAIAAGAEAVFGRAVIDPVEALRIPARLHEADALEGAYAAVLDEIAAVADPDPADPWPRHDEHSGASIAVTAAAFHAAGGMPAIAPGEDRAFFRSLRRIDARIRHDRAIRVTVSGRVEGRASGGMADTMRRRIVQLDEMLDDRLEPARISLRRVLLRAGLRAVWRAGEPAHPAPPRLARRLGITPARLGCCLAQPAFGAAWEAIEAASPALQRRRVPASAILDEARTARRFLALLRGPQSPASRSSRHSASRRAAIGLTVSDAHAAMNSSAA